MRFLFKNLVKLIVLIILADIFYIGFLWFKFDANQKISPQSRFMSSYQQNQQSNSGLPKIDWRPIALTDVPEKVWRVFVIAEDSRFFVHSGFDFQAIRLAIEESIKQQSIPRGASTISQQTAKNLYLYPERSWLRKWHELVFTVLLELTQSKSRLLEIYLNVAEFDLGVYGINAASLHYFNKPAAAISVRQAAYLAAALPWPQKHNFRTNTQSFRNYARKIYRRASRETFPR